MIPSHLTLDQTFEAEFRDQDKKITQSYRIGIQTKFSGTQEAGQEDEKN